MKRIFGSSKPAAPPVTLNEATQKVDARVSGLDEKIKKLDQELHGYKDKMSKLKPGTGPHNLMKQRALKVLKQKKMYENQRDQLANQSFNMEQANFATESMRDTITTVGAMKSANVELKKQFKNVKIDDIDSMQDELQDLLEQSNEIQESLGRSYDVGDVDETELEDELAALSEELDFESAPSYLTANALPSAPGEADPYATAQPSALTSTL